MTRAKPSGAKMRMLEGELRGLEINTASRSADVYITVRVWPKLALYLKEQMRGRVGKKEYLIFPTIADAALHHITFGLHKRFGLDAEVTGKIMRLTDRQALVELLRCP